MSRSIKEDYLHTMNRIARLEKKKSEFEEKEKSCNARIKRLVVSWIKKNRKEWLKKTPGEGFINVIVNPDNKHEKILVKVYEFTSEPNEVGETGKWINHEVKINEL
jgi:nucleoside-triphosphatase THEP1